MESIKYSGKTFELRELNLKEFGEVLIASTELSDLLMNDEGDDYGSEEARYIDEQICYFVTPEQMKTQDDLLLALILDNEID